MDLDPRREATNLVKALGCTSDLPKPYSTVYTIDARKLRPVAEQGGDAWEVAKCLDGNYDKAWGKGDSGFLGTMVWVISGVRVGFCEGFGEPMA